MYAAHSNPTFTQVPHPVILPSFIRAPQLPFLPLSPPSQPPSPPLHTPQTNNLPKIAEAYRRHGITPTTRDIVVIKVIISDDASTPSSEADSKVAAHLSSRGISGRQVPFSDAELRECTDWARVRKYYKLGGAAALAPGLQPGQRPGPELEREAEALVLGAMALRGL